MENGECSGGSKVATCFGAGSKYHMIISKGLLFW